MYYYQCLTTKPCVPAGLRRRRQCLSGSFPLGRDENNPPEQQQQQQQQCPTSLATTSSTISRTAPVNRSFHLQQEENENDEQHEQQQPQRQQKRQRQLRNQLLLQNSSSPHEARAVVVSISSSSRRRRRHAAPVLLLVLLLTVLLFHPCQSWEWSDWIPTTTVTTTASSKEQKEKEDYLTLQEISKWRIRDIKRRLTRKHGYSAEELDRRMRSSLGLDKKEWIMALAFEEEKLRLAAVTERNRQITIQGVIATVIAVLVVMMWPLFRQVYDMALVNWVVYTDTKRHEMTRCWQFQSVSALLGVLLLLVIDLLQAWLTISILLSWVMTKNRYFFPMPHVPIRPAQFLSAASSSTSSSTTTSNPLSSFGINVGPMLVTWMLRWMHGQVQHGTGRLLQRADKLQRAQERAAARQHETPEQRASRKEARRAAKRSAHEQQQQQQQRSAQPPPPPPPPPDWGQGAVHLGSSAPAPPNMVPNSRAHLEFLSQLQQQQEEEEENSSSRPILTEDDDNNENGNSTTNLSEWQDITEVIEEEEYVSELHELD